MFFFFFSVIIWNWLIRVWWKEEKGKEKRKNDVSSNFEIELTNETKAWLVVGLASSTQVDKSSTSGESQRLAWVHEGTRTPFTVVTAGTTSAMRHPSLRRYAVRPSHLAPLENRPGRPVSETELQMLNVTKLFVTPVILATSIIVIPNTLHSSA